MCLKKTILIYKHMIWHYSTRIVTTARLNELDVFLLLKAC